MAPTQMRSDKSRRFQGFTLIELIIIVLILSILGAIVIPKYSIAKDEAAAVALQNNIHVVHQQLVYRQSTTGQWPTTIDPTWFINSQVPKHPQNSFAVPSVQVQSVPGQQHPADKTLTAGSAGAYWYNPATGNFRARVPAKATAEETLSFYNQVNASDEAE